MYQALPPFFRASAQAIIARKGGEPGNEATVVTHSNYTYRIVSISTNIIIHEGSELYLCNGSEIEIRQRQHAVRVTIIVLATRANIHMRVIFFACAQAKHLAGQIINTLKVWHIFTHIIPIHTHSTPSHIHGMKVIARAWYRRLL